MFGAILGDMIGAPYEFDRGDKTKDFPMFTDDSQYTDDTVMTIAVAEALMDTMGKDEDAIKAALVSSMQKWGKQYPNAGYGKIQSPEHARENNWTCTEKWQNGLYFVKQM